MEMDQNQKNIVDRAVYLRGRIITHFAQCEYLLADISVRVDRRFVYLLKKRVKAVQTITAETGPYQKYADELVPLANHLMQWEEIRNFLAHGMIFLLFVKNTGSYLLEFRRYQRVDSEKFEHRTWHISLEEFETASNAMAEHCDKFLKAFRRIYNEQGLEDKYRELFD